MEANPYAAPTASLADQVVPAPALWNPNAAASWSLLFTPAFGSFLQMRNWQAMGEDAKAKASWYWFIATFALIALAMLPTFLLPETHALNKIADRAGFIILLTWYISNGREQAKVVSDRFGKNYPRRPWLVPILVGFAGVIAFLVVIVVLVLALGVRL